MELSFKPQPGSYILFNEELVYVEVPEIEYDRGRLVYIYTLRTEDNKWYPAYYIGTIVH